MSVCSKWSREYGCRWCIQQADPVQTILDPFMGSGTTRVSAFEIWM
jgi:DNA modification methylase